MSGPKAKWGHVLAQADDVRDAGEQLRATVRARGPDSDEAADDLEDFIQAAEPLVSLWTDRGLASQREETPDMAGRPATRRRRFQDDAPVLDAALTNIYEIAVRIVWVGLDLNEVAGQARRAALATAIPETLRLVDQFGHARDALEAALDGGPGPTGPDDERDRFCYEAYTAKRPDKEIVAEVKARGWTRVLPGSAVRKIAVRIAKRYGWPEPEVRPRGRRRKPL